MTFEEELEIYKERYKAMKQIAESAAIIIDKIIPTQETISWKRLAEAHGVGDKRPQQIHRKDYNNGESNDNNSGPDA